MLSTSTGFGRLSKEILAVTEISKTLTSPLEFSELLAAVTKKIVSAVEQANIGSICWLVSTSSIWFRP